jgi:hypothetical protein
MKPSLSGGVDKTVRRWWVRGAVAICLPFLLFLAGAQIILTHPQGDSGRTAGAPASGWIDDVPVTTSPGHDVWPSCAVDKNGSLFVAYSDFNSSTGYYRISVAKSIDAGLNWTEVADISPGNGDCRYASIGYDGVADRLYIAFQHDYSSTDHDIYCAESSTGVSTPWALRGVRIDTDDDYHPSLAVIDSGWNNDGVYVVLENQRGIIDGTDLVLFKAKTGGSFSIVSDFAGNSDSLAYSWPSTAILYENSTNRGILYVAYARQANILTSQEDIYVAFTQDGGSSWSSKYRLASDSKDEFSPSVAVTADYCLVAYTLQYSVTDTDIYCVTTNFTDTSTPISISDSMDLEAWPEVASFASKFYVAYPRGDSLISSKVCLKSADEALYPTWSTASAASDSSSEADGGYRPAFALQERNGTHYAVIAWADYRNGAGNSDIYYSTEGARYAIGTSPTGYNFTVDGTNYSANQTFNWPAGTLHNISTSSVQNGDIFNCWTDGVSNWTMNSLNVTAGMIDASFEAKFLGIPIPEFQDILLPISSIAAFAITFKLKSKKRGGDA